MSLPRALAEAAHLATSVRDLLDQDGRDLVDRLRRDCDFATAWMNASNAFHDAHPEVFRAQWSDATIALVQAFDAEWARLARDLPPMTRGGSS